MPLGLAEDYTMATLNSALRISNATQTELDQLVQKVAKRIAQASNFLDVRATPLDWPAGPPDPLNGVRPHVSALEWKSMKWREAFWYVLNKDGLSSNLSMESCDSISRRARDGEGSFYLVAPISLAAKAKDWADRHQIRVTSFWVFSG